jgi:DNA-binding MarR family transcriptional regulator
MPTRDQTRDNLLDALLSTARALVAVAARSLADLDIEVTLPQFRALTVLAYRGPQRGSDIATELGVNPSTGTRMVDRLVRKGLVHRERPAVNRREVRLSLTPAGRDLVREVTRRRRVQLRRLIGAMPVATYPSVTDALREVSAAAGESPEHQWWLGWSDGRPPAEDGQTRSSASTPRSSRKANPQAAALS